MAAALSAAGDLDRPFATEQALATLAALSAASVDGYLKLARGWMRIKGISTTKPSSLLPTSISIRTCADEAAPGVIEADTAAQRGPSLVGKFARTLTMTDIVIGWTEDYSNRNDASHLRGVFLLGVPGLARAPTFRCRTGTIVERRPCRIKFQERSRLDPVPVDRSDLDVASLRNPVAPLGPILAGAQLWAST